MGCSSGMLTRGGRWRSPRNVAQEPPGGGRLRVTLRVPAPTRSPLRADRRADSCIAILPWPPAMITHISNPTGLAVVQSFCWS
jgi:hypothetical protein